MNCWFCNKNTWVPYLDKDKWNCPSCEQYNGFTADGDYNVELRAQYSPKYNKQAQGNGLHLPHPSSNQLCAACNRNQELKVHQLASFTPSNEATYDAEVEQYEEQLEEVYRLCPACERIVKRKLNQAKTLILGLKRSNVKNRSQKATKKSLGFGAKLKRFLEHVLIFSVVILLAQYFISPWLVHLLSTDGFNVNLLTSLWTDSGLDNLGYRLALGITILVLLGRGEPMTFVEYVSILSLSCLHFLIGEQLLHQWSYFPRISDHLPAIEWTLRLVALLSGVIMFVESLRRSPTSSVKLNNSFHRIEVEDADEENDCDDSSSLRRRGRCLDTSSDFGSVFESVYQPAAQQTVAPEDEEIRSISLNSSRRSFHNNSDPLVRSLYQKPSGRVEWSPQHPLHPPPRPSISTTNLFMNNSPSKLLHSDDRFSNSIKSMRIGGEYHQIQSPTPNPFMKQVPLSGSSSSLFSGNSTATLRCSSRSLLTPSRLSLVSGGGGGGSSGFQSPGEYKNSSWLAGGFWNHPNVFAARAPSAVSSFACTNKVVPTPAKGMSPYSYSMDNGLNDRFVPLTESRSSSQSSGFESRQSTSSCQLPAAFSPIGQKESLFNDQSSVSSAHWSELRGSQLSRRPPTSSWSTCDTMGMGAFLQPNVFPT